MSASSRPTGTTRESCARGRPRWPALRIVRRRQHSGRLVEQHVGELLGSDSLAVDLDPVGGLDERVELPGLAIHSHASGLDQLVRLSAGSDSRAGEVAFSRTRIGLHGAPRAHGRGPGGTLLGRVARARRRLREARARSALPLRPLPLADRSRPRRDRRLDAHRRPRRPHLEAPARHARLARDLPPPPRSWRRRRPRPTRSRAGGSRSGWAPAGWPRSTSGSASTFRRRRSGCGRWPSTSSRSTGSCERTRSRSSSPVRR